MFRPNNAPHCVVSVLSTFRFFYYKSFRNAEYLL